MAAVRPGDYSSHNVAAALVWVAVWAGPAPARGAGSFFSSARRNIFQHRIIPPVVMMPANIYATIYATEGLPGDEILRRRFGTHDIGVETRLSESIIQFILSLDFFFIATSNHLGECDSSYRAKGKGVPALKILDEKTLIFPHYLGNGTFRSLGNMVENPHIGLLFMDFKTGLRVRVNGDAELSEEPAWLEMFPHSLQTVKVTVQEVYRQNQPAARPAPVPSAP